jgi:YbbR domain-containing protein
VGRVNVPIMVCSLGISVFFWFYVYGQNLTEKLTQPFALTADNTSNLPAGLYVDRDIDGVIGKATFSFQGPREAVERASQNFDPKLDASVDLSNAVEGTGFYPVTFRTHSMENLVPTLPKIKVTIERLVSKKVPINIEGEGHLRDQAFTVSDYEQSAHYATLQGPKSVLDLIDHCRAYVDLREIDLDKPMPQESIRVNAIGPDNREYTNNLTIDPPNITITPTVSAVSASKLVVVSAVVAGDPAKGFMFDGTEIQPTEVTLLGDNLKLATITAIKTEKVDVTGITGTKRFRVKLQSLPGVASKPSTVEVICHVIPESQLQVVPPTQPATTSPLSTSGGGVPPP